MTQLHQHGQRNFKPTPHHSNTVQLKPNLIIKNSSRIIRKLITPVNNISNNAIEGFSSKPSDLDFDVVIDKPSKQDSLRSSKTKNCPVIEVGQTIKHSDEQVNTRKEMKTVPTQNASNADNNTVQQNNKEWRKCTRLILGDSTISGLMEKKMSRNRKIKVRYSPGTLIKDKYHYAIPLLEKKPENIILHLGTNDAPQEVNSLETTTENSDDIIDGLKTLRLIHSQNPIIARINISSIRNKFETLASLVPSDINILMI